MSDIKSTVLYGAIIGDISSSPYERHPIKTKDYKFIRQSGHFTDDTVMTIAVADALLTCQGLNEHDVKAAVTKVMQRWGRKYPHAGYGHGFKGWLKADKPHPYKSFGNGAAMRVSPVALIAYISNHFELARDVARWTAEVTHNHPEAVKSVEAVASAINFAQHGVRKDEIKAYVESEFGYDLSRTLDEIRPTYDFEVSAAKSVPEAIIAFLESTDFEDAIRNAVSLGGDADTQAAIAGSIAEAFYGVPDKLKAAVREKLPLEMIRVLDEINRVVHMQETLTELHGNEDIYDAMRFFRETNSPDELLKLLYTIHRRLDRCFIVALEKMSSDEDSDNYAPITVHHEQANHTFMSVFTNFYAFNKVLRDNPKLKCTTTPIKNLLDTCAEINVKVQNSDAPTNVGLAINPFNDEAFALPAELIDIVLKGDTSTGDTSTGDTSAADTSTDDTSTVDTSAVDTSTVDTSAADTSTDDTSTDDTATIDTSTVDTSTGDTSTDDTSTADTSTIDTSTGDTSTDDTSTVDTSAIDTSTIDTATIDTSTGDTSTADTATADTATIDTATIDTATIDTSTIDTATIDTSTGDTSTADTATADTATIDTSTGDTSTIDTATGDTSTGDTSTIDTSTADTSTGKFSAEKSQAYKNLVERAKTRYRQYNPKVKPTDADKDCTRKFAEKFADRQSFWDALKAKGLTWTQTSNDNTTDMWARNALSKAIACGFDPNDALALFAPTVDGVNICDEINMYTYWQGFGYAKKTPRIKYLLVAQDWGNFINAPDEFKSTVAKMNAGEDIFPAIGTDKTSVNLVELFKVLGRDVTKACGDVFFTNFCLGYRLGKDSGGMTKTLMMRDADLFRELCEILQPENILCLGRLTSECVWETLTSNKFSEICGGNYNDFLDARKCINVDFNGKTSQIYPLAHCGGMGTAMRSFDRQRADWRRIAREQFEKIFRDALYIIFEYPSSYPSMYYLDSNGDSHGVKLKDYLDKIFSRLPDFDKPDDNDWHFFYGGMGYYFLVNKKVLDSYMRKTGIDKTACEIWIDEKAALETIAELKR